MKTNILLKLIAVATILAMSACGKGSGNNNNSSNASHYVISEEYSNNGRVRYKCYSVNRNNGNLSNSRDCSNSQIDFFRNTSNRVNSYGGGQAQMYECYRPSNNNNNNYNYNNSYMQAGCQQYNGFSNFTNNNNNFNNFNNNNNIWNNPGYNSQYYYTYPIQTPYYCNSIFGC